jgi:hypothetical protein
MNKSRFSSFTGVLLVVPMALAMVSKTTAITVTEVGVSPYETPTITCTGIGTARVYAGINQLFVDGTPMNGFCIDPFHWSLPTSTGYSYVALQNAPKGNLMGATTATYIERLWGSYYSTALSSATVAAGLQIAIWELVGGTQFTLDSANDYGAAGYITAVESATYSGPVASLIGLTGPGQDYVVAGSLPNGGGVPDGGWTLALLGGALALLESARRRLNLNRN